METLIIYDILHTLVCFLEFSAKVLTYQSAKVKQSAKGEKCSCMTDPKLCVECGKTLVKQEVYSDTSLPLSAKDKRVLRRWRTNEARFLECSVCGCLCMQTAYDALSGILHCDGTGLCTSCGGNHERKRLRSYSSHLSQKPNISTARRLSCSCNQVSAVCRLGNMFCI